MPAIFEGYGVRFAYPENWTADGWREDANRSEVTVSSEGTAFWTLSIHPLSETPQRLVETALEALREEYEDLEVEPANETVGSRQLQGVDVYFYCLDLTNTASLRGFRGHNASYLLLYQAEDREFDAMRAVFQAMTISLLREMDEGE